MQKNAIRQGIKLLAMAGLLALVASKSAAAQASTQVVHLARLEIDPAQLASYQAARIEASACF